VSGDMAPLREPGLDRAAEAGDTARRVSTGRQRAEPSLVKVLATTVHLWLRRRVLRTPDGVRVAPVRWVAPAVCVAVLAGGIVTGVALSHSAATVARGRLRPHATPSVNPVLAATAANEQAAAAWISAQVSIHTPVACDAATCQFLQTRGMPSVQQVEIGPGDATPHPGAVVVETPLLRTEEGSTLAADAPEIVATFGHGSEQVALRVTSAGGTAGYLAAARQTLQASTRAGQALAAGGQVHMSAATRHLLVSGRVDPRLQSLLGKLAATRVVYLVAIGGAAPGATWPTMLRSITLIRFAAAKDLPAALAALRPLLAPYQATTTIRQLLPGDVVQLTIRVPAPSPM
jgi:hypothetical protein